MTRTHDPRVSIAVARFSVVESPGASDPAALLFALELLARWTVRARHARTPDAPTSDDVASYAPEKCLDAGAPSED
jgi:hypothetical protein